MMPLRKALLACVRGMSGDAFPETEGIGRNSRDALKKSRML